MRAHLGSRLKLPPSHPTGVETMASYEEVLHLLRYRNWHTRSLLDRKFKLICSELNGRYLSNEFKVEVSPGCPPQSPGRPPQRASSKSNQMS